MKYQLFFILLMFSAQPSSAAEVPLTTFYLIRHAEKELNIKTDPPLTDEGRLRSQQWAEVFSQIELDFVYSTDTTRTRDTASAVAETHDLDLRFYTPKDFDYDGFIEQHRGHSILVVGHSNTSPAFANGLLGADQYPELDETIYGTLYIVDINAAHRSSKALMINPIPKQ